MVKVYVNLCRSHPIPILQYQNNSVLRPNPNKRYIPTFFKRNTDNTKAILHDQHKRTGQNSAATSSQQLTRNDCDRK